MSRQARQLEPWVAKLRLKADAERCPLRRRPCHHQNDCEDYGDLTPKDSPSAHTGSSRQKRGSRSESRCSGAPASWRLGTRLMAEQMLRATVPVDGRKPGSLNRIEPEPWPFDGGKRREAVLDHDHWPPRVVRKVGWRVCLKCVRPSSARTCCACGCATGAKVKTKSRWPVGASDARTRQLRRATGNRRS